MAEDTNLKFCVQIDRRGYYSSYYNKKVKNWPKGGVAYVVEF